MENNKEMRNEKVVVNEMKREDPMNVNQINKSFLADASFSSVLISPGSWFR